MTENNQILCIFDPYHFKKVNFCNNNLNLFLIPFLLWLWEKSYLNTLFKNCFIFFKESGDFRVTEQPNSDGDRERYAQRGTERSRSTRGLQRVAQLAWVHEKQLCKRHWAKLHHANCVRSNTVKQWHNQSLCASESCQNHELILRVYGSVHGPSAFCRKNIL